jgi:uncharacterized spore protein YtfJ
MDLSNATDEMVRTIGGMPQELGASACFGEPIERNGHTLIPVARVNFGYGLGFGGGSGSKIGPSGNGSSSTDVGDVGEGGGGGGGGGGSSSPVAVIDISGDGIRIEPVEDRTRISMAGIMFAAWAAFWLLMTIRSVSHERGKTRRFEMERTLS